MTFRTAFILWAWATTVIILLDAFWILWRAYPSFMEERAIYVTEYEHCIVEQHESREYCTITARRKAGEKK
jgi:hypothetical protein